ncbi:aminoglycoside phosphotransferase APH(3') [Psychromonas ossibalaenae]|uniref:aminoglycoside phosphotransferase APH(3') n=1 Tax=Psychromonas ossibalaenae TaxID=444922 RepID=UPI000524EE6F|nr:aminoglycoside phosphotransferase APH(3') [Psychromonas ossibalaenae]
MLIDTTLVKKLVDKQFPQWSSEGISPVEKSGWDNRTFHLGKNMLVRLPSSDDYVSQVEKEQRWLPELAKVASLPIPRPVAKGISSTDFPRPWSVYEWIEGETILNKCPKDLDSIAYDLAEFLNSLDKADTEGAPLAGKHNFYRGCSLNNYEKDIYKSLEVLKNEIDTETVIAVWDKASEHEWSQPSVWFHGDMSLGNILVKDGKLSAIIDFGCSAVGDPACDLAIAWTLFEGNSRRIFEEKRNVDAYTWNRGRGWALWKALIIWSGIDSNQSDRNKVEQIVREIVIDHQLQLG